MKTRGYEKQILAAALFAGVLSVDGCRSREAEAVKSIDMNSFIVKTEKAAERMLEEQLLLVGSVKAKDEAVLYPRVPGKLMQNLLREGDPVRKNEPVATIERDEVGVVFEPAPVPSTLNGVVGKIYLDVGAHVTPQTPVALVVDQSQVRVKVDLPERYVGQIRQGQKAYLSVEAYPDKSFIGTVSRVSPVVDFQSRNSAIEVLVDNADRRLKSGMFAQVKLVVGRKASALSVPIAALQESSDGTASVFVVSEGKAAQRSVRVGFRTKDFVEISEGIQPDDEVIIEGLYGLKDGSAVKRAEN
ncbi:MAG TPA: efflux RND transporter periplasmic adaptor subunit [Elusimicrobiota bacterium]|nr:efflux RND transporter periplasmic adaptor subunit [Elusimicrobiota bacterium]